MNKKVFEVYDPIFKQSITVFLNCDETDWVKWQKKHNILNQDTLDANTIGFSTFVSSEGEPNKYIIWVNQFNWTLDNQETLIHECVHTIIKIWEANNIPVSSDNQEFLAHSIGGLYSTIAAKIMLSKK